jgi:hypothetical protein
MPHARRRAYFRECVERGRSSDRLVNRRWGAKTSAASTRAAIGWDSPEVTAGRRRSPRHALARADPAHRCSDALLLLRRGWFRLRGCAVRSHGC